MSISAALVAPVEAILVVLVEMLLVLVAMLAALVAPVLAIFEALVTVRPETVDISPVGEVLCSVPSPKIMFLLELRLMCSVDVHASVASSQVHFLSLSVDFTTMPPSFTAESPPIGVPLFEASSSCLSAIVTVVLSR